MTQFVVLAHYIIGNFELIIYKNNPKYKPKMACGVIGQNRYDHIATFATEEKAKLFVELLNGATQQESR